MTRQVFISKANGHASRLASAAAPAAPLARLPRSQQIGRQQQQQQRAAPAQAATSRGEAAAAAAAVVAPRHQDWPVLAGTAAACAAVISAGVMMMSPSSDMADAPFVPYVPKTLADTVIPRYRNLDANKDGLISRAELAPLEADLWLKWAEGMAPPVMADVSPFERFEEGTLTAQGALHYLGLEASINADGCVAAGVWQVFDANGDGGVTAREWDRALGDLGADGDAAKRMVFSRVDRAAGGAGALSGDSFRTALQQIRGIVTGGGGAEGVVFGPK